VVCHKFWKRCTLIFKLKKYHRLYNFNTSIFFKLNFGIKFIFCYFLVPDWEKREKSHWIPAIEREIHRWHRFRPLKKTIFGLNYSFWWGKFLLCVFFTFKVREKKYELKLIFGFELILFFEIVVFLRSWICLSWFLRCFL